MTGMFLPYPINILINYYDGNWMQFILFGFPRYVHGCLQSCNDADACNTSNKLFVLSQQRQQINVALLILIFYVFDLSDLLLR